MNHFFKKLTLATLVMASFGSMAADNETVLIGLAGPLTGPSARIGKDLENGAPLEIGRASSRESG